MFLSGFLLPIGLFVCFAYDNNVDDIVADEREIELRRLVSAHQFPSLHFLAVCSPFARAAAASQQIIIFH